MLDSGEVELGQCLPGIEFRDEASFDCFVEAVFDGFEKFAVMMFVIVLSMFAFIMLPSFMTFALFVFTTLPMFTLGTLPMGLALAFGSFAMLALGMFTTFISFTLAMFLMLAAFFLLMFDLAADALQSLGDFGLMLAHLLAFFRWHGAVFFCFRFTPLGHVLFDFGVFGLGLFFGQVAAFDTFFEASFDGFEVGFVALLLSIATFVKLFFDFGEFFLRFFFSDVAALDGALDTFFDVFEIAFSAGGLFTFFVALLGQTRKGEEGGGGEGQEQVFHDFLDYLSSLTLRLRNL